METLSTYAQPFFEWLLRSTVQAGIVVCLILLIQALRKLSNTLRQYLLEIREQPRGLLDDIEILVLGRIDPDGYGWV